MDQADGVVASPGWCNEALGQRRCGHGEAIRSTDGFTDDLTGRQVVRVIGVEEPDDDARVEVDQRHSSRSVSSSPAR